MFFKPAKAIQAPPAQDLVTVTLSTLINLAKAAAGLKLQHTAIKSMQSGGYVSRFKGRGMEFDEVRLYQPGDDIRRIDWKVTARSGAPHTKTFREERERPIFIAVDNRPTMQFATRGVFKSVQAAKLAALIAWAAEKQGDRIGGQLFSLHQCQELKPQNGKQAVLRFLNLLASNTSASNSSVAAATQSEPALSLDQILARLIQHTRPGNRIYIISDFRGMNSKAEQHLMRLARHCEVVLIMVYDPLESSLPTKGRYRFTDGERDRVVDGGDKQRVLAYQQRFSEHQHHLEQLAKKIGLAFMSCTTHADPLSRLR
ncbi:MAG: DUF58 domain-containing protein [Methylococcales bacterium]|nr:DUF58 domain-containing protein [Methylococcales bacterium]